MDYSKKAYSLHDLLPVALQIIKESLATAPSNSDSEKRRRYQAISIYDAENGDSLAVQAALVSAITELQRKNPPDSTLTSKEAMAEDLIRIAYNRWQRRKRRDQRLRAEAERGERIAVDDGNPVISMVPENIQHFSAQISELLDLMEEKLSPRSRQILMLRLEGHTQEEIAKQLGCHRSAISRVENRAKQLLRDLHSKKLD